MTADFKLPDFADMQELADKISTLKYRKMILDIEIKSAISDIVQLVTVEEKYFIKGRPPAMNFIENTYSYSGLDGELIEKRKDLAEVISELSHKELLMGIYHDMIEVWRTASANERASIA